MAQTFQDTSPDKINKATWVEASSMSPSAVATSPLSGETYCDVFGRTYIFTMDDEWKRIYLGLGTQTEEQETLGDIGVFAGGSLTGAYDEIDVISYIAISTPGNASDFGNLYQATQRNAGTSNGSGDIGVFAGGTLDLGSYIKTIQYITISTPNNASFFGNLNEYMGQGNGATSNGSNDKGIIGGGKKSSTSTNSIEYITISSTSDGTEYGDLLNPKYNLDALSNGTDDKGVFVGGIKDDTTELNVIEYFTISSNGNADTQRDLTINRYEVGATSNGTNDRGIIAGSGTSNLNSIDYITISSTTNASDFGNLITFTRGMRAISNKINEMGIFAGGYNDTNVMEYIMISVGGTASDFGDLQNNQLGYPSGCSNS